MDPRAQSESIGVILLTAVIVILTVLAGGIILGSIDTQDEPAVNLRVSINTANVTIGHHGGTEIPLNDTSVVLQSGRTNRSALSSFFERQGDGNGIFEPGEQVTRTHNTTETVQVLVVHEPSNTVLYNRAFDVPYS